MAEPPLVRYSTIDEYHNHFKRIYCRAPVLTFDCIEVRFRIKSFSHCFYESSQRNLVKDKFSKTRAERIDWIKAALQDPNLNYIVVGIEKRKSMTKHAE
ncbi:MAG: hypothetical protein ACYCXF_07875 [Thermoleophilia bacterium]